MSRTVRTASALSAAVGLAMGLQLAPASAQMMGGGMMDMGKMPPVVQKNMMRAKKEHLQKCYGINAVGRNDCAEGAHSCAGQATLRATRRRSCSCRRVTAARSPAAS